MARYSRRTGPPTNFTLNAPSTLIPGLTLTRFFDHGEILIMAQALAKNTIAQTANILMTTELNGVELLPTQVFVRPPADTLITLTSHILIAITKGTHTIRLTAAGQFTPTGHILAGRATLTVIQLPQWDTDADIA